MAHIFIIPLSAAAHTRHNMAHFAEIVDGIVARVIVISNADTASNGVEDEAIGAAFCHNLLGGEWVQTSYNTLGGVHNSGGTPYRKNYAGRGYAYDTVRDAFIVPKPFASWVLDEATCLWTAPVPMPSEGRPWRWDEATLSWVAL